MREGVLGRDVLLWAKEIMRVFTNRNQKMRYDIFI